MAWVRASPLTKLQCPHPTRNTSIEFNEMRCKWIRQTALSGDNVSTRPLDQWRIQLQNDPTLPLTPSTPQRWQCSGPRFRGRQVWRNVPFAYYSIYAAKSHLLCPRTVLGKPVTVPLSARAYAKVLRFSDVVLLCYINYRALYGLLK